MALDARTNGYDGPMAGDDAFEAMEMHDGAPVLHRDKHVSRRMAGFIAASGLLQIAIAIFVAIANGSSSKPMPPTMLPVFVGAMIAFGLAMMVLGVVVGVLRTVVTKKAVHVKYGLWGPTIPLEAIQSCRVTEYDWTEFGGWGMRRGRNNSWAYVPKSGPVVEVKYLEDGKTKRVLIGASDAASTTQAIDAARAAGRVRVGDAVAEAEADAVRIAEEEEAAEDETATEQKKA